MSHTFSSRLCGAATLFCTTVVAATAASGTPGELPIEDEFDTDPFFSSPPSRTAAEAASTPAAAASAAAWSEGKVSLAGLLSLQWARQDLRLGTLEYLSLAVIVLYVLVYIRGRRRNYQIAHGFIKGVHDLFCSRFLEAGPASEIPPANKRQLLARESCSSFLYYATGSRRCSGVLIKISLTKRHDLFMLLWNLVSPVLDRVTVEVGLDDDDMEPMVFAVTRKRDVKKLLQDVPHLQDFVGITRATSLPPGLVCLSETPALLDPLLQPHAVKILSENSDLLELMHFTDQNEEPILGQAQTPRKALRFVFRLPVDSGGKSGDNSGGTKMIELAVHYIELLHKFKMSPVMKKKALERRDSVAKRKERLTNAQRQERFQQLKNERLQREREEYESLTPEQKRRRDLRDEKKAKKASSNRKLKMKMTKT